MNPLLAALVQAGVISQADADAYAAALSGDTASDTGALFGEFEISEKDIRLAMSTWDELMPDDLRGLLDAEIVDDGNAAGDVAGSTPQEGA